MTPEALAALHALAFTDTPRPWSAAEFAALLAEPSTLLVARTEGFALGRVAGPEAELLTLAVASRRRGGAGSGGRCVAAFEAAAAARGRRGGAARGGGDQRARRARSTQALGYVAVGRRPGYYRRRRGAAGRRAGAAPRARAAAGKTN